MFTGIIEQIGRIESITASRFVLKHSYEEAFMLGESIALNGMCSTVVASSVGIIEVDIIWESRELTTFGTAKEGDLINLERAAIVGQRNSGHQVTGHIDEVGTIAKLEFIEDFWLVRVTIKPEHRQWLVLKGSVAVAGISLTVSGLSQIPESASDQAWFEVSIIPHTWQQTILENLKVGEGVNIEFDILGKYAMNQVIK